MTDFRVDPGLIKGRFRVDSGVIWGRSRVDPGDLESIQGRFGVLSKVDFVKILGAIPVDIASNPYVEQYIKFLTLKTRPQL